MPKITLKLRFPTIFKDLASYFQFLRNYIKNRGYGVFSRFESLKDVVVDILYKKRGKYTRPFLHLGAVGLGFLLITVGPIVFAKTDNQKSGQVARPVLSTATAYAPDMYTKQAEEVRQFRGGEIITHSVEENETISSIAEKYNLQVDTILWENDLTETAKIKPGQELRILPIDGVRHKVAKGETIYTIGKKYGLEGSAVQVIVDYPFNEFLNDETFELVVGQTLMIPDGIMPKKIPVAPKATYGKITPDAGTVTATGNFVWPASGYISQGYRFYHKAIDIAARGGGPILAADSGTVTAAGWPDSYGYGNRVMVDHGNGFVTLYAHLSVIQVQVGQRVNRGDVLGQMGNTGRSTGTHLHFEIRQGGALMNPESYLK